MTTYSRKDQALRIKNEAEINEKAFVCMAWNDPKDILIKYENVLREEDFTMDYWRTMYSIGLKMFKEGFRQFNKTEVELYLSRTGYLPLVEKYGGLEPLEEARVELGVYTENAEIYARKIEKMAYMRDAYRLYGEQVYINQPKYRWEEMTAQEIQAHWMKEASQLGLRLVNHHQIQYLLCSNEERKESLKETEEEIMHYFESPMLNKVTDGHARGNITVWGGFGNTGKSSIMVSLYLMACIHRQEKTLLILNEEGLDSIRTKVSLSMISKYAPDKRVDRRRVSKGKGTPQEEKLVDEVWDKLTTVAGDNKELVRVVFMDSYNPDELEVIIRNSHAEGYVNLIIDTHKVSEGGRQNKARWESFVDDTRRIYNLTKKEGNGLNLRTFLSVQLADSAIRNRYLDFATLGEGKAMKNEASSVNLFRPIWDDEYPNGKNALEVFQFVDTLDTNNKVVTKRKRVFLKDDVSYLLVFTPKNRSGANTNSGGLGVLVLEADYEMNNFKEVGFTTVARDY